MNHRKLLDAMLETCGVDVKDLRAVCSSIDKLDKQPWNEIRDELVKQRHILCASAEKIGTYVLRKGFSFVSSLFTQKFLFPL